jgi:mRNA-degrading endonuclease RelE of RelBE toxin-antitoxin system
MKYEVRWTETSLKQLKKLDGGVARRIVDKVESRGSFRTRPKLRGFDLCKLRVGGLPGYNQHRKKENGSVCSGSWTQKRGLSEVLRRS